MEKTQVLNQYGNPKQEYTREVIKAEDAFIKSLKPTLDSLSLVDARIILNFALVTMTVDSAYLLRRQVEERKALREQRRQENERHQQSLR
jgi:hypothetical protein